MSDQSGPKNVGLVELSDDGIEVLGQYTRDPGWHVAVVACKNPKAKAARMAGLLDARLVEEPTADDLAVCSRVVLGYGEAIPRAMIRDLRARGVEVYIWNGDEAAPRKDSTENISRDTLYGLRNEEPRDMDEEGVPIVRLGDPAPEPEFLTDAAAYEEQSPVPELTSEDLEPMEEAAALEAPQALPKEEALTPSPPSSKRSPSQIWSAPVRRNSTALRELLDNVRRSTQAQSASMMAPDETGSALHLEASLGFEEYGETPAARSTGGLAWDCFQAGEPRWKEAEVPGFAESSEQPLRRISVSVPVMSERRVMGVMNINRDTREDISARELVEIMSPFAGVAARTLIKATDFSAYGADELSARLMKVVDRIMSFDENLAVRLQDAADVIAQAVEGDVAHALLVDSMGRRLEWMGTAKGMRPQHTEVDRGFLGWALRQEIPQVMEAESRDGSERRANVYLPILSNHPCGLLILENVRLGRFSREELVQVLTNVSNLLGEVLNVAEGMGAQELMSDMKMRILDASSGLENVPPQDRIHALLDLVVDLTAANTAMWLTSSEARPITVKPGSKESQRIISESLFSMDTLSSLTAEHGVWSWGMGAGDEPDLLEGIQLPSPVVAMQEPGGDGALYVFFSEPEAKAFTAQMPPEMLYEIMRGVVEMMSLSRAA